MKNSAILGVIIAGFITLTGCSDLFGPQIYFTNTSAITSWNLVIYDSNGDQYSSIGTIPAGSSSPSESIIAGDYVLASDQGGVRCILDTFTVEDGKDNTGSFFSRTLGSFTYYGAKVNKDE